MAENEIGGYARAILEAADPTGCLLLHPAAVGMAEVSAAVRNAEPRRMNRVAMVPLEGMLTRRNRWGTATEMFAATMSALAADSQIDSILIDVDSPGGATVGTPEAGAAVRAAAAVKPVIAHTGDLMASAAYWIGSQAGEIVASPSAWVGSVGVYIMHADFSKMLEAAGVTISYIYAARHKVEGNQFEPLSDAAREYFQTVVDDTYQKFVGAVAKGRGVTPEAVRSGFGQGRVLRADKALEAGMIDRIETLPETLARMQTPGRLRMARRAQATVEAELGLLGKKI